MPRVSVHLCGGCSDHHELPSQVSAARWRRQAKEGQRVIVSQGFITPRHRWRPQWCVVAGFLPPNSQAVRSGSKKKKVFSYERDISYKLSNTDSCQQIQNKMNKTFSKSEVIMGWWSLFLSGHVGSLMARKEQRPADHQA